MASDCSEIDIIIDEKASAVVQMEKDCACIEQLITLKKPLLRLYEWKEPSVTYGHFIDPAKTIKNFPWPKAKRPTGGGVLFHYHDFSFSFACPATHPLYSNTVSENYRWVNEIVIEVIKRVFPKIDQIVCSSQESVFDTFCMATPTPFDVVINGVKVGGAAQRKTKAGFVHQSSLFLNELPWQDLEGYLEPMLIQEMRQKSTFLSQYSLQKVSREDVIEAFTAAFG